MASRRSDADSDAALRRTLRARLGVLGAPLQILAEDVLGEDDGSIDWVAMEPDGRLCVVLVGSEGADETLLVRGLAQRAWVQARVADWRQLVPGLAARADLRPRLLLIAPDFARVVRIAAREADPDTVRLARFRWLPSDEASGHGATLSLELLEPPASPQRPSPAHGAPPLTSVFRSGLRDRDFADEGDAGER